MQSDLRDICRRVDEMRNSPSAQRRVTNMDRVRLVRRGDIDQLFPDLFAEDMPKSVVANLIDVAARNVAEKMAALPALACVAGNMATAADEARSTKKNKIGSYYWAESNLSEAQFGAADGFNSYSFTPYVVEPHWEKACPRIRVDTPFGAYYRRDRFGRVMQYAKVRYSTAGELAALYPDHAAQILLDNNGIKRSGSTHLELVEYLDDHCHVVYVPQCQHLVLAYAKNLLSRCPVVIAERWDLEDTKRGAYDDVVYVQLARAVMALFQLKGAQQAVEAPIAVPDDVNEINLGPDAILRTNNPQAIRRINLELPAQVFGLTEQLNTEAYTGARYPESRTGGMQASIITGRGVQELQDTMSDQVQSAQVVFKRALEEVTALCFEMDVTLWPQQKKTIEGFLSGKPFKIEYIPARDIGDSFTCKVMYGFTAGMSPAQAAVMLLQLRGDKWVSRDTARRHAPIEIDPDEEQRAVDQELMEDGLLQGFAAYAQAIGPMAMQGQDPRQILTAAAKAIELRTKGKPLHQAILEAFPEPEAPEAPAAPPGGELPPGIQDNGLPRGVAPGQAGMPPGGMPAISSLMAELRGNGQPRMSATVMRKQAIGNG